MTANLNEKVKHLSSSNSFNLPCVPKNKTSPPATFKIFDLQ